MSIWRRHRSSDAHDGAARSDHRECWSHCPCRRCRRCPAWRRRRRSRWRCRPIHSDDPVGPDGLFSAHDPFGADDPFSSDDAFGPNGPFSANGRFGTACIARPALDPPNRHAAWARHLSSCLVKVLNSIIARSLAEAGRPSESTDRVALPISGDNPRSKEIVAQLLDQLGFDSVDAGTIAESWRQQPGSPVYCTNPSRSELELWLKKVDRSSLADYKEKGSATYLSVVDADYQTQANAYRAIFR
jgi:hypothetical protein